MSRFDLWLIIIIRRPAPDKVRGQRMEDVSEYFTVPSRGVIPQFVSVRGERIGNEVIIVNPEFVIIQDGSRAHGYGDCGQEALLFITLCRLNGIPARWQSGWDTFPGVEDIHDWTEIYLAPYGWLPVDPYMSIFATQYADRLAPAERREVRDFYFGGRGQWRMAANADHEQTLVPAKKSFRSDDVDFQRGELECEGRNIYFNHYHYNFVVKELPSSPQD